MNRPLFDKILTNGQRWAVLGLPVAIVLLLVGWSGWQMSDPAPREQHRITQRGREFRPVEISIRQGDVVRIVNDDEDLTHHAYVASPGFKFDSGDQGPGHDVDIQFTKSGLYNVLCGIHPKMRLSVQVERQ